ncbi:hypothetical protein [Silvimonas sp.]|uniref:hypothetical protein n=1 Tax=Silvimonas sp. TaxID=2650811 RepID=UPI002850D1DD|nr:hypothetical protein [Silvimonas sp.]MDR3429707.1 hypothetical protein [Silvimonas sp.]
MTRPTFYEQAIQAAHEEYVTQVAELARRLADFTTTRTTIERIEALATDLNRIAGIRADLNPTMPHRVEVTLSSEFLFDELRDITAASGWDRFESHPSMAPRAGFTWYIAHSTRERDLSWVLVPLQITEAAPLFATASEVTA